MSSADQRLGRDGLEVVRARRRAEDGFAGIWMVKLAGVSRVCQGSGSSECTHEGKGPMWSEARGGYEEGESGQYDRIRRWCHRSDMEWKVADEQSRDGRAQCAYGKDNASKYGRLAAHCDGSLTLESIQSCRAKQGCSGEKFPMRKGYDPARAEPR